MLSVSANESLYTGNLMFTRHVDFDTTSRRHDVAPSSLASVDHGETLADYHRPETERDNISVFTRDVIPEFTVCGEWSCRRQIRDHRGSGGLSVWDGDAEWTGYGVKGIVPRLNSVDELRPAEIKLEVEFEAGELRPVRIFSSQGFSQPFALETPTMFWMCHIRAARDRYEQNIEIVSRVMSKGYDVGTSDGGCKGGVVLRTLRTLRPGEELLVWYGEALGRHCGVPILSPANITIARKYVCPACEQLFEFPNSLKSHILFRCAQKYTRPLTQTTPMSFSSTPTRPTSFTDSSTLASPTAVTIATRNIADSPYPRIRSGFGGYSSVLDSLVSSDDWRATGLQLLEPAQGVFRSGFKMSYENIKIGRHTIDNGNGCFKRTLAEIDTGARRNGFVKGEEASIRKSPISQTDKINRSGSSCKKFLGFDSRERDSFRLDADSICNRVDKSSALYKNEGEVCLNTGKHINVTQSPSSADSPSRRISRQNPLTVASRAVIRSRNSDDSDFSANEDEVDEWRKPSRNVTNNDSTLGINKHNGSDGGDDENVKKFRSPRGVIEDNGRSPDAEPIRLVNSSDENDKLNQQQQGLVTSLKVNFSKTEQGQGTGPARAHRRQHPCAFCGKMYSRKYGLTIHLRTHSGYKPLHCRICRRPFGDPSNLNKHVRLHAAARATMLGRMTTAANGGETQYGCTQCGKVLVRRRDLERHVRSRHSSQSCE